MSVIGWGISPNHYSAQAVDGKSHVGFRLPLELYHCLCYKNDVILFDQSKVSW